LRKTELILPSALMALLMKMKGLVSYRLLKGAASHVIAKTCITNT